MAQVMDFNLVKVNSIHENFENIEYRGAGAEKVAHLTDSHLAVWEVIMVAKQYNMDVISVAAYFSRPKSWVASAFKYYAAHPQEIDIAVEYCCSMTYEKLKMIVPNLELSNSLGGSVSIV